MGRKGFPEKDMNARSTACAAPTSAWTTRSSRAAGRGCSARTPTLADISLMPAIVRMADLGLATMWKDMPRVARWYDEIRAHPAFKPTYYFGSLLTERFPHLRESRA